MHIHIRVKVYKIVMYLEWRADLDVLAALHRVNLTDQETSDS